MSAVRIALDRVVRYAPFGVRFRDVATGQSVSDGLVLTEVATGIKALANRSDVFVATAFPGPRCVVYASQPAGSSSESPSTATVWLERTPTFAGRSPPLGRSAPQAGSTARKKMASASARPGWRRNRQRLEVRASVTSLSLRRCLSPRSGDATRRRCGSPFRLQQRVSPVTLRRAADWIPPSSKGSVGEAGSRLAERLHGPSRDFSQTGRLMRLGGAI